MEIRYFKHYSNCLGRDMEFKVYGHGGKPVMFIPCQAGRFFDFENYKMIDYWAKWIEAGQCTVYACDVIDGETYADVNGDSVVNVFDAALLYSYVNGKLDGFPGQN